MEEKIKNIMSAVFRCEASEINDNTSPDTVQYWDSLRHMNLIAALEDEFGVSFTENEIVEMLNYKLVCLTVADKLK